MKPGDVVRTDNLDGPGDVFYLLLEYINYPPVTYQSFTSLASTRWVCLVLCSSNENLKPGGLYEPDDRFLRAGELVT